MWKKVKDIIKVMIEGLMFMLIVTVLLVSKGTTINDLGDGGNFRIFSYKFFPSARPLNFFPLESAS